MFDGRIFLACQQMYKSKFRTSKYLREFFLLFVENYQRLLIKAQFNE